MRIKGVVGWFALLVCVLALCAAPAFAAENSAPASSENARPHATVSQPNGSASDSPSAQASQGVPAGTSGTSSSKTPASDSASSNPPSVSSKSDAEEPVSSSTSSGSTAAEPADSTPGSAASSKEATQSGTAPEADADTRNTASAASEADNANTGATESSKTSAGPAPSASTSSPVKPKASSSTSTTAKTITAASGDSTATKSTTTSSETPAKPEPATPEPSTAIGKTILGWAIDGLTCSEPTAAKASSIPHVNKTGKVAGKSIVGAVLTPTFVQAITVTKACLQSYGNKARKFLEKVMSIIPSMGDTSGKTLYHVILPSGTYILNDVLHIYSNTWLDLRAGTRFVRGFSYGPLLRGAHSEQKAHGYDLLTNACVQGGTWDANSSAYKKVRTTTMRFGHARNILVLGCTFKGCLNSHMLELGGTADVTVAHCTFKNSTGDQRFKEALQIETINNPTASPSYRYWDDTPSKNIIVWKNTFSNVGRGVGYHESVRGVYCSRILIEGNTFSKTWEAAIALPGFRYYLIRGNKIRGCGAGIYCPSVGTKLRSPHSRTSWHVRSGTHGCIRDNIIKTVRRGSTSHYGICIEGAVVSGHAYNIGRIAVRANTISAYGDGITLYRARHLNMADNKVASRRHCGITAVRSRVRLTRVTVQGCRRDGVYASEGSHVSLATCKIRSLKGSGIRASERAHVTAKHSRISSCRKWGAYASGRKTRITLKKTKVNACRKGRLHAVGAATISSS